jgi:hypothetical protein
MDPLPCRAVVEALSDYLEGVGPAAVRARLARHLERCRGCLDHLDQLRITIRLLGGLRGEGRWGRADGGA